MKTECPYGCEDGVVWDDNWCGDEDHCPSRYLCPLHGEDDEGPQPPAQTHPPG